MSPDISRAQSVNVPDVFPHPIAQQTGPAGAIGRPAAAGHVCPGEFRKTSAHTLAVAVTLACRASTAIDVPRAVTAVRTLMVLARDAAAIARACRAAGVHVGSGVVVAAEMQAVPSAFGRALASTGGRASLRALSGAVPATLSVAVPLAIALA